MGILSYSLLALVAFCIVMLIRHVLRLHRDTIADVPSSFDGLTMDEYHRSTEGIAEDFRPMIIGTAKPSPIFLPPPGPSRLLLFVDDEAPRTNPTRPTVTFFDEQLPFIVPPEKQGATLQRKALGRSLVFSKALGRSIPARILQRCHNGSFIVDTERGVMRKRRLECA